MEILWTIAPSVTPARPLIFCGIRVVAESERELAGIGLLLVEELDVLAEDDAEGERAQARRELCRGAREELVLEADSEYREDLDVMNQSAFRSPSNRRCECFMSKKPLIPFTKMIL